MDGWINYFQKEKRGSCGHTTTELHQHPLAPSNKRKNSSKDGCHSEPWREHKKRKFLGDIILIKTYAHQKWNVATNPTGGYVSDIVSSAGCWHRQAELTTPTKSASSIPFPPSLHTFHGHVCKHLCASTST
jgi:hypothetical protein